MESFGPIASVDQELEITLQQTEVQGDSLKTSVGASNTSDVSEQFVSPAVAVSNQDVAADSEIALRAWQLPMHTCLVDSGATTCWLRPWMECSILKKSVL